MVLDEIRFKSAPDIRGFGAVYVVAASRGKSPPSIDDERRCCAGCRTEFDCFSKVESSACAATTCRARQSAAGFVDRKLFFTEWKLLYNGISFIG
jgi:hypothetical protein